MVKFWMYDKVRGINFLMNWIQGVRKKSRMLPKLCLSPRKTVLPLSEMRTAAEDARAGAMSRVQFWACSV